MKWEEWALERLKQEEAAIAAEAAKQAERDRREAEAARVSSVRRLNDLLLQWGVPYVLPLGGEPQIWRDPYALRYGVYYGDPCLKVWGLPPYPLPEDPFDEEENPRAEDGTEFANVILSNAADLAAWIASPCAAWPPEKKEEPKALLSPALPAIPEEEQKKPRPVLLDEFRDLRNAEVWAAANPDYYLMSITPYVFIDDGQGQTWYVVALRRRGGFEE